MQRLFFPTSKILQIISPLDFLKLLKMGLLFISCDNDDIAHKTIIYGLLCDLCLFIFAFNFHDKID